jgi:paraquat-inducible protein B
MARRASPAVIGGFVLGAVVLAVAGLAILGGGKFFRPTQRWVAYFDESIRGLAIGAPVTFRGVKVGSVSDITVVVDREARVVRIPVIFEIEADRLTESGGGQVQLLQDRAGARIAFEQGLRAQLELQSFVTGQLSINLDLHPRTPMKPVGGSTPYPEFPTIPSTMAALGQSLNDLNVAEMAQDIRRTVQGVERLVNSPESKKILVSAVAALEGTNKLVRTADAKLASLGPALEQTSAALTETLATIRTLAQHVDNQTVPAATGAFGEAGQLARRLSTETVPAANQLLGDAQGLARRLDVETVPAVTQVLTDLRPLVGELVKTVAAARAALEQAQQTLATAQEAVEDHSPLQFQIQTTLQEVSGAARAIRSLSDYLERHPEAVLFGKEGR